MLIANGILLAGDGERIFPASMQQRNLVRQVARRIHWSAPLEAQTEVGVSSIPDLANGNALADTAHALVASIRCYAADEFIRLMGSESGSPQN